MRVIFADSYYYLALINRRDSAHEKAVDFSKTTTASTVTTAWVLTEVADGMSSPSDKDAFLRLLSSLKNNPLCHIVDPCSELFDKGVALYASRKDKGWSLTDCVSFVVMREEGLSEALTGDRHFEQAGFLALLA